MRTTGLLLAMAVVVVGCYEGGARVADSDDAGPPTSDDAPADDEGEDDADSGSPGHHGEGDADTPAGRRVRRMTAAQFHASLVTVSGQAWPLFDEYAGAMGQADFAEITEEGREISVTFDKFVHDAAMYSCNAAVTADLTGASPATVLRWVDVSERETDKIRRNLDYLILRFLGQEMKDEDVRVDPWMNLLTALPEQGELDDALMQERWTAVCVGLVTHPDFVTY